MASILPHPKGWRVQLTIKGERDSKVFASKRDAQQWAARRETEMRSGSVVGGKTLGQAIARYAKDVSPKKDGSPWELRRLAVMLEHFGDVPLRELRAPQITGWRDARLKTVSGSTVVREANLLRNVLNVARREWEWMDHLPFDGVKLPKQNPARQALWTWPLIKRVLRAPRTGKTAEMQAAFHIALRSGMRLQEVLAAPANFDAKRRVVTIKTKTEARAQIPIGRIAARLLARPAFTVGANEGSVLFSKLCRELLIEGLTFHDARATALTHLAKRVDVLTLAKISRHKDLSLLSNVYYRERAETIAARI